MLEPALISIAFRRWGKVHIIRQDGAADWKSDCHPIHPIICQALESVEESLIADRVVGLIIIGEETHALSTVEGYDGFIAEEGLCHGQGLGTLAPKAVSTQTKLVKSFCVPSCLHQVRCSLG